MLLLDPASRARLHSSLLPDRPGPLVALHVLRTGNGALFVDRWPHPRALLAASAGNYSLTGDPSAVRGHELAGRLAGMVDAPAGFEPLLRDAFPDLKVWERVILELSEGKAGPLRERPGLRRLRSGDAALVWGLSAEIAWISRTWGGPDGLASSGTAWGAFVDGRLASLAVSFFVGDRHEDIGVVTEAEHRGKGLSAACAARLCEEIRGRGRTPSWSTSPDNAASLRVADKLGFRRARDDLLYVVAQPIPPVARPPGPSR